MIRRAASCRSRPQGQTSYQAQGDCDEDNIDRWWRRADKLTQSKRPVSLAAIAREPLVVVTGTVATHRAACVGGGAGSPPRIAMEVDHPESLRRMVERGLGVALLPELMARDRQGANFDVAEVRDAPRRTVALVHRGERSLTSAARALKRVIAERLQRRP